MLRRWLERSLYAALLVASLTTLAADTIAPAEAYRQRQYALAQTAFAAQGGYDGHFGAGAAAWHLSDYRAAARHFSATLLLARDDRQRGDALYNLGNALYGQSAWRGAVDAYASVLRMRPSDGRARKNLAQAQLRLARQNTATPFRSDLRGRRGRLAEGIVNLDWDSDAAVQDFDTRELGPLRGGTDAEGALRQGSPAGRGTDGAAEISAARLQSGLKKLDLLRDQPADMLRGMMRQDRVPGAPNTERAPW